MKSIRAALLICGIFATGVPAHGMEYGRVVVGDGGKVIVLAKGPIEIGDFNKLNNFIGRMPSSDDIVGFMVDSPGGNLAEALTLGKALRAENTTVIVPADGECVSACFVLLSSANRRIVDVNAKVGVHSASTRNGQETELAQSMTLTMIREIANYGVPPAIITKLIQTPPQGMAWLTPDDLRSMNVVLTNNSHSAPLPVARYQPPVAQRPVIARSAPVASFPAGRPIILAPPQY